ncbi:MAG: hypothetical protein IIB57_02780 [Planctomycetes bacterium]|nr:hypothetical protein [Planctomycetota bacterium]
MIGQLETELRELEARQVLARHLKAVLAEIERKKRFAAYQLCLDETRTNAITRKSSEVTKLAVTEQLARSFKQELATLKFRDIEVEMVAAGGSRGALFHKLQLRRAPSTPVPKVVSEGEARCLSIASFFAELSTTPDRSAILFDDPVSSLGHIWRDNVAARLVKESKFRQVIVFTHDIVFMLSLVDHADKSGQNVKHQTVRRGATLAGLSEHGPPYIGMKVSDRIRYLKNLLQAAGVLHRENKPKEYDQAGTDIYEHLRQAWERGIEEVEELVRLAVGGLEELGAQVYEVALPLAAESRASFRTIASSESVVYWTDNFQADDLATWTELHPRLEEGRKTSFADYIHAQHKRAFIRQELVNVLKQVTVIAPRHAPARWLLDILEDERLLRKDREIRNEYITQSRGAILDVHENMIPWYDEIRYSDEWPEIISRKERRHPGEERRDILLLSALDRRVPVDFRRTPLDQAIEHFAQADRLNIIVNWHDLDRAGIDRKTEVDLSLPNEITLKKALTEVLDQAGAGKAELGFDVDEGVINIATRQLLDKKTFPVIYDINDLLMEIPQFTDAPMTDLRDATAASERRIRRSADRPWQYGDDDDDEPEPNPEHSRRVRKIIHLIEETVAPDSWRDRGGSVGSMQEINGQLVVTQNSASHRQISGLLDKLREERAIQVSVEALFITVSSHYLEEMGIDLDIVLNAGSAGLDFLNGGGAPLIDPVLGNRLLLPRSFSQLGAVPTATNLGQTLGTAGVPLQPFLQPFLVPQQSGGSGSRSTPIPILSNILEFTSAASLSSDVPGSFAGSNIAPALSIFGSFLDNIQVDFLVRATQADSRSSVLTAPRLVVFNGGSAWIAVTIQQNFVQTLLPVVATGAVAVAPVTSTIDAGATLFVRATVTADRRYIMMLIAPGVTRLLALQTFAFSGGTGAGQAFVQLPTLSAQRIQTMVSVPDGGTLLIGGQKLATEVEVEAGVPILSKIPILKRLYSSRSMIKDEQVLLILVKPKILIHSEQEEIAFPSFTQR